MATQPDASGGLKGFLPDLLGTLTGGLKLVAAGELSKRYGFSFGADDTVSVDAYGTVKKSSAPAKNLNAGDQLATLFRNPFVLTATIAVVVVVGVMVVRKL